MTLRTKGAEKNANNLGTFLENIPIVTHRVVVVCGCVDLLTCWYESLYCEVCGV